MDQTSISGAAAGFFHCPGTFCTGKNCCPNSSQPNMNRRRFLEHLTHLFSLAVGALFTLPVFRFISGNLAEKPLQSWIPLLRTDANIPTGNFVQIGFKRAVQNGWTRRLVEHVVWVRKKTDGSFLVFSPYCTHLGCAFTWETKGKEFRCPCHGGKFNENGNRIAGPPPRPLDRYETKVKDNMLMIGKLLKV